MPKKQELYLATVALYFNLAAGEKEHLTLQEQQFLTRCMEANFPALKQEARRLTKKMPTPKKMTKKKMSVFMITMAITVAVLVILSILSFFVTGCDVLQLSPPEDILKHPVISIRKKITKDGERKGIMKRLDVIQATKFVNVCSYLEQVQESFYV